MKKLASLGATLVLALSAGSVSAANSLNAGTFGINVDTNDHSIINGKYLVTKDLAVLAGFGLAVRNNTVGPVSISSTDTSFLIGVRKYLKTDDFAPFVGGRFTLVTTNDSNTTDLEFLGEAGVEYFVGKQFSIEGRVGFGFRSTETQFPPSTITEKDTIFGSSSASISANFYF